MDLRLPFLCICLLLTVLCSCKRDLETLDPVKSYTSLANQTTAVQALIQRIIGNRSVEIEAIVISSSTLEDYVHFETSNGVLKIQGTSGIAVAFGFNHFLKYYCRAHISWAGDQLKSISNPLPSVPKPGVTLKAGVKYRYYQNVCTVSYSSVWWNWTRWEREIDWMALNGINLPLAFTGQEALWQRVYMKLGFTEQHLNDHFAGPAFLAWGRMGNIHGWGGPLPSSWKETQLQLQHKILIRMKSLGMIPVLPGFAGHVPSAITQLYPQAQVSKLGGWSGFNCSYSCTILLEPNDPLFKTIGAMFIDEQMREYNGTNHIYSADTFNEMTPRSSNISYLASSGRAIYEALVEKDPHAVWLMQGWLFHSDPSFWKIPQIKALVTAIPQGRLLILDLFSEAYPQYYKTDFYFGQPFIWCMLHDFGGNLGFYGKLDIINKSPSLAMSAVNSSMVGTGITPEGINQNYIVYEFMLEQGYSLQPTNISQWIENYVTRRYNSDNNNLVDVWHILGNSIYNDISNGFPRKSLIRGSLVKRPSLSFSGIPYWYTHNRLAEAWDSFAKSIDTLDDIETVCYDAVDITRQMLQTIQRSLYGSLIEVFQRKQNISELCLLGDLILDLLNDFDRILMTDQHFMLGMWIQDARDQGISEQEKDLYEYNARNQVTLWGPTGNILDYANKHWGSLTSLYYWPRWALFVFHLKQAMVKGMEFDNAEFEKNVFKNIEEPFTFSKTLLPTKPAENAIAVSEELYLKWRPYLAL